MAWRGVSIVFTGRTGAHIVFSPLTDMQRRIIDGLDVGGGSWR